MAILEVELQHLGAAAELVERAGSEMTGVEAPLAWARPGVLVVLPVHAFSARDAVTAELVARAASAA